ncbi:hypothetical protein D3H65_30625 [Paraflavitalea soli]|uniref:Uncharacterized protein n=2 Tax=Paraflavitalea soli TaxID=2315862 RepID=A0A3B7MX78_9BACT|nr:hypothetical protein D3H65_30625 [Paraflavitalea soli]
MMGRKLEEGDWSYVYCKAKNIPEKGWSNLDIDIIHNNMGLEQKMLCYRSNSDLANVYGTTQMHPSLTRSIRIPDTKDPNQAMADLLNQYSQLVKDRKKRVASQNTTEQEVEMRTGWLLWQESLRQFLYFEEEMLEPNPEEYVAEWRETVGGGSRKRSVNLWIYEKKTGKKRYSITTSAGAKIQPYFDIPSPIDPNVYLFTVIGEAVRIGYVRIWLTDSTFKELKRAFNTIDPDEISDKLIAFCSSIEIKEEADPLTHKEEGMSLEIRTDAYKLLTESVKGVSDEHSIRIILSQMK